MTPFAVGYGKIINFDHDFIGREAIERMIQEGESERTQKVTLLWDTDDVVGVYRSFFTDELPAKFIDMPVGKYNTVQLDTVRLNGEPVGVSGWLSASAEDKAVLSTAIIDSGIEIGTEVTILWGEDPNSSKIRVEPHRQVEIRATVAPSPLGEYARTQYRKD